MYIVYLSPKKPVPKEGVRSTFNSKKKFKNLGVVVHVLQNTQNLVISRCCFEDDGTEMYKSFKRTGRAIV